MTRWVSASTVSAEPALKAEFLDLYRAAGARYGILGSLAHWPAAWTTISASRIRRATFGPS